MERGYFLWHETIPLSNLWGQQKLAVGRFSGRLRIFRVDAFNVDDSLYDVSTVRQRQEAELRLTNIIMV